MFLPITFTDAAYGVPTSWIGVLDYRECRDRGDPAV